MPAKLVALIVAAALTIGWLLASIVSPPVAKLQGLPDRAERREPAPEPRVETPFTAELHLKLQTVPVAPVPRRNPFVYGSASRRAEPRDPARTDESAAPATDRAPMAVAAGPSLWLSGIGSTTTEAGPVRTAIISDGTTVHLVKVGETVTGYAVIDITDDAVTLVDAAGPLVLRRK